MNTFQPVSVGIVGSGFIARGLTMLLEYQDDVKISRVLTRSDPKTRGDFPRSDLLTNSLSKLLADSDVVFECSGDPIYATEIVDTVMANQMPVFTMNAEFQVTTGSHFVHRGLITEVEGDQPGCLATLKENIRQMGFKPWVYGNIKGFLNHKPTYEDMLFWAKKQGISLRQVTSFTDGTKVQIERALIANGLGAGIAVSGLLGIASRDVDSGARALADGAKRLGHPISDYILAPGSPPGVFIAAEHEDPRQTDYLRYLKLGDGPYYVLSTNFHLCHLEVLKTIRKVLRSGKVLLNNSDTPEIGVAAIAKRDLRPGEKIARGIGSFDVRGKAIRIKEDLDHVPIGLLCDATLTREVRAEQQINFGDVELPKTLALKAWLEIKGKVIGHGDSFS
jgi:predicted homoserine dehydrogenase-like protein